MRIHESRLEDVGGVWGATASALRVPEDLGQWPDEVVVALRAGGERRLQRVAQATARCGATYAGQRSTLRIINDRPTVFESVERARGAITGAVETYGPPDQVECLDELGHAGESPWEPGAIAGYLEEGMTVVLKWERDDCEWGVRCK